MVYLDFEQPLEDLHAQLDKIQQVAKSGDVNVEPMIAELEQKISEKTIEIYSNLNGWQRVQLSRHPERPHTLDYINNVFEDFVELHGDRNVHDDKAIVGGLAKLNGQTIMVIGHQKGSNTKMRQYRNFGMANPEGYRKAFRLMKLAEKFEFPIVTLIDTPGAYPGIEAEDRGQAEAIAHNMLVMSQLKTQILCYIIGEGASGGAIGIGLGDKVFMLENTWYSVISPESCSSILWHSWDYKERAAELLRLTATDMLQFGLVDGIVEEPLGGAHSKPNEMYEILKNHLAEQVKKTKRFKIENLINNRIDKFRNMGEYDILK